MTNDNVWVAFHCFFSNRWVIEINILIIVNIISEPKTSDATFSLRLHPLTSLTLYFITGVGVIASYSCTKRTDNHLKKLDVNITYACIQGFNVEGHLTEALC